MLNHLVVNSYNLWVVIFVALGTISTAYGLAIIGSTVGQPNFYTYFNLASAGEPGAKLKLPFKRIDGSAEY
jgi:hypothetical protein